ncbi:DDB1- and CUL4-associated factor 10 [Microplitis mediator]|uniref:DDB1- and CUL4-associated factor 10 n=1 Tax=Microplitis mediator TaxID=375433 RepID=UPI0025527F69|nr:DDB1- and CUL4-associated factor 10 [Microplitis mediator]
MPKIKKLDSPGSSLWWLRQREVGLNSPVGYGDRFYKTLYSSIQPVTSWDHGNNLNNAIHGGVFNLEFSPDGSLLVAACEKKSILMFDPLGRRLIKALDNAHNDCVNCVKFLDHRMFATCSDDNSVALWDARNLKYKIRSLLGHTKWVKSIEYSPQDQLLLTSGFDGSIYSWDINSATENSLLFTQVFHTNGLMRTRLTPDAKKILVSTTSGYLIIIHNLRLSTLAQDLDGFKPNVYRLMQVSQTTLPVAASYTHLFSQSRKYNRVEFITDFPQGNDAEFISSLQVHPQGWCVLSRNVGNEEKSEYTCVHDIQDYQVPVVDDDDDNKRDYGSSSADLSGLYNLNTTGTSTPANPSNQTATTGPNDSDQSSIRYSFVIDNQNSRLSELRPDNRIPSNFEVVAIRSNVNSNNDPRVPGNSQQHQQQQQQSQQDRRNHHHVYNNGNFSAANMELHVSSTDVWEALVAVRENRSRRERELEQIINNNNHNQANNPRHWMLRRPLRDDRSHTVFILGDRSSANNSSLSTTQAAFAIPRNHKIHQNVPRLINYIQEPNVGLGYIKELCFSADGRLICSPFGFGIRLLGFSNECQELSACVPDMDRPRQLCELATTLSHTDIVLSTKFSPKHCLLVSGCLSGKIVWHQPVI